MTTDAGGARGGGGCLRDGHACGHGPLEGDDKPTTGVHDMLHGGAIGTVVRKVEAAANEGFTNDIVLRHGASDDGGTAR